MLHRTPARKELLGLQPVQIGAHSTGQLGGGMRSAIPQQDDFARVDLDHLDVVDALVVGQQGGSAPAARDDQAVSVLGPHGAADSTGRQSMCAAASRSARSPWKTRSPTRTAGTSAMPSAMAAAVASPSCSAMDRIAAPLITALGGISQAAAAIRTESSSASERPPAKAWRKAAWAKGTVRPIDLA